MLHFVKGVRTFFDRDSFAVPNELGQLCLLGLQYALKFVQLTLCHLPISCLVSSFIFFLRVSICFFNPSISRHIALDAK